MINKSHAISITMFHDNTERNRDGSCKRWRRNGRTKTWKTNPDRWEVPVKNGLRSYGVITNSNAEHFHSEQECTNSVQ